MSKDTFVSKGFGNQKHAMHTGKFEGCEKFTSHVYAIRQLAQHQSFPDEA